MKSEICPNLSDEAQLVLNLAIAPLDPREANRYAQRKLLLYFFISVFGIGLPVTVFLFMTLQEWGFSKWFITGGIAIILLVFFIFFYGMIAIIVSRSKILGQLGIHPASAVERKGLSNDVAMVAERHGRRLEYGVSQNGNFWRHPQAHPTFSAEYRDGGFHFSPNTILPVHKVLQGISSNRIWRGLNIQSGPEGLKTTRPVRLAKYFLQDLWLLERVLSALK